MRKRLGNLFLCIVLVCAALGTTALAADGDPIEIYVDEDLVGRAGDALMIGDTVFVPLRAVCAYYGAELTWDAAANKATVTMEGTYMETTLWSNCLVANGRVLYDEEVSVLYRDSLMVPARQLAKALNCSVSWNGAEDSVHFYSGTGPIESGDTFYNEDDLYWLSRIIYCEAGNQLLEGKVAVGNVVLNRVASDAFPDTIYDVLFQRNQFCPAGNGAIYRTPNEESVLAAKLVLEGLNTAGEALFFQNTAITGSNWMSNTRPVVVELGNHTFYA